MTIKAIKSAAWLVSILVVLALVRQFALSLMDKAATGEVRAAVRDTMAAMDHEAIEVQDAATMAIEDRSATRAIIHVLIDGVMIATTFGAVLRISKRGARHNSPELD